METAKDMTGPAIRDAIEATKGFQGVSGTINLDQDHNAEKSGGRPRHHEERGEVRRRSSTRWLGVRRVLGLTALASRAPPAQRDNPSPACAHRVPAVPGDGCRWARSTRYRAGLHDGVRRAAAHQLRARRRVHAGCLLRAIYLANSLDLEAHVLGRAFIVYVGSMIIAAALGVADERFAHGRPASGARLTSLITAIGVSSLLEYGFQPPAIPGLGIPFPPRPLPALLPRAVHVLSHGSPSGAGSMLRRRNGSASCIFTQVHRVPDQVRDPRCARFRSTRRWPGSWAPT